jgi:hypothetical protein
MARRMNMEQLTDKQIKARAYYAKNAGKIKAQKKAIYVKNTGIAITKKSTAKPAVVPAHKKLTVKIVVPGNVVPARNVSARERIENMRIEKELSVNSYE